MLILYLVQLTSSVFYVGGSRVCSKGEVSWVSNWLLLQCELLKHNHLVLGNNLVDILWHSRSSQIPKNGMWTWVRILQFSEGRMAALKVGGRELSLTLHNSWTDVSTQMAPEFWSGRTSFYFYMNLWTILWAKFLAAGLLSVFIAGSSEPQEWQKLPGFTVGTIGVYQLSGVSSKKRSKQVWPLKAAC